MPTRADPPKPAASPEEFTIASPLNGMTSDDKSEEKWTGMMGMMERMMKAMQSQIELLQKKLEDKDDKKLNKDGVPFMNAKDVDKPVKYDGTQFRIWYANFLGFLETKDERFEMILTAIKAMSKSPLTPESEKIIARSAQIDNEAVTKAFKMQMYRYLQTYTKGESHTIVLAGGPEGSWEAMRQLCDAGCSQQQYCQREERRKIWHPKQCTMENLKVAIATWENELEEYMKTTGEAMDSKTKISCIEDMCPTDLQEVLSDKADAKLIVTYADYKQAINNHIHKKIRFSKSKPKINALTGEQKENDDESAQDAGGNEDESLNKEIEKLLAMVKGKIGKKGKGKGNYGGGNYFNGKNGAAAMDVDKPVCHECGDENHFVRDCPVRAAKNLEKGKDGKGKGKDGKGKHGKGGKNGKGGVPNLATWNSYYPGPSPTTWKSWYPNAPPPNGKVNLFEQPYQMNALQASPTPQDVLQGLFATGNFYKFVDKGPKAKVVPKVQTDFLSDNMFSKLTNEDDNDSRKCQCREPRSSSPDIKAGWGMNPPFHPNRPQVTTSINLLDAVKRPSTNAARRQKIKEDKAKKRSEDLDFFNAINEFIKVEDLQGQVADADAVPTQTAEAGGHAHG